MQFTPTEDKKLYKLPDGARRMYETKKAERFPPATSMTVETSDAATSTVKPTKNRKREDSIVDPYSMTSRYGPKRDRGTVAVEKRRNLKVAGQKAHPSNQAQQLELTSDLVPSRIG